MSGAPMFSAVSSSARQMFLLLRCIALSTKADVQITSEAIRFLVEETRVSQGIADLDKDWFSSYIFNPPTDNENGDNLASQPSSLPPFQISLMALLETLQIFGVSEPTSTFSNRNQYFSSSNAFNTPALGLGGTCRLAYTEIGSPLTITLSEADINTTCEIMTYEPASETDQETIPFERENLNLKVIMPGFWLSEAMTELSSTNPDVLVLMATSSRMQVLSLQGLGGAYGDSMVEYRPEGKGNSSSRSPEVTEVFQINPPDSSGKVKQRYRFDLIKKAARAMALASKVSVRLDRQGVLSLQFMIQLNEGSSRDHSGSTNGKAAGRLSFIDFRFVPLLDEQDDGELTDDGDDANSGSETTSD